jgi:hypothetical protein
MSSQAPEPPAATDPELQEYFAPHFEIEEFRGLDLFHSRFAPDARWNPFTLGSDSTLFKVLEDLETAYATEPAFMEKRIASPDIGAAKKQINEAGEDQRLFSPAFL